MTYKETVSRLMSHSNDLNMMPGDGIQDEMQIMLTGAIPYLKMKYPSRMHLLASAAIFRCASKYAAQYADKEQYVLWAEMEELYIRKNHDYGNSWADELTHYWKEEHNYIMCLNMRLYEKINRIIAVTRDGAMVNDESIAETLMDICNYCVMTNMWMDDNKL